MKRKLLLLSFVLLIQSIAFAQDYTLLFDGANSRVKYPNDTTLDMMNGATDYTIEAWFYPTDADIHNNVILKRWYQFAITMYQDANRRIYFTHYSNGGVDKVFVNSLYNVVNLNEWNHVAVINNSTDNTIKIYVNGVDVTADSSGTATTHTALPLEAAPGSSANFYVGYGGSGTVPYAYIDKVRVKKTAEDIANLHTSDVSATPYTTDADTALLLNFDEGSGTTTANEATGTMATLECSGGCAEIPVWDLVATTMATNQIADTAFNVYPNPVTSDHFSVQAQNDEHIQAIEITDILGKVVRTKKYTSNPSSVNISTDGLSQGVYLIKTTTNKGMGTQKLLIK